MMTSSSNIKSKLLVGIISQGVIFLPVIPNNPVVAFIEEGQDIYSFALHPVFKIILGCIIMRRWPISLTYLLKIIMTSWI